MNNPSYSKTLQVVNQTDELNRVSIWLEELGEECELSMQLVLSLNLVLEEALTNTILYGFEDEKQHSIQIDLSKNENNIVIKLTDDGREYDPTLKSDPDISLSVEERPIGGLGFLFMKKIMDTIEYQRIENQNILILKKNIL